MGQAARVPPQVSAAAGSCLGRVGRGARSAGAHLQAKVEASGLLPHLQSVRVKLRDLLSRAPEDMPREADTADAGRSGSGAAGGGSGGGSGAKKKGSTMHAWAVGVVVLTAFSSLLWSSMAANRAAVGVQRDANEIRSSSSSHSRPARGGAGGRKGRPVGAAATAKGAWVEPPPPPPSERKRKQSLMQKFQKIDGISMSTFEGKSVVLNKLQFLPKDKLTGDRGKDALTLRSMPGARPYVAFPVRLDLEGSKDLYRRVTCSVDEDFVASWNHHDKKMSGPALTWKKPTCLVHFHFPSEVIKQLPDKDGLPLKESCAVVGNSGRLLHQDLGKDIDDHDVVIRINYAPTHGYEKHVGSKTTYDAINHFHAARLAWGEEKDGTRKRPHIRRSRVVMFESTQSRAYAHLYPAIFRTLSPDNIVVLSPDFAISANEMWMRLLSGMMDQELVKAPIRRSDGRCARHRDGTFGGEAGKDKEGAEATCARPLSGWFAVVFSLFVCKQVDLYGFDMVNANAPVPVTNETAKYHYFDSVEGMTSTHSFDATLTAFLYLRDRLKMNIHLH